VVEWWGMSKNTTPLVIANWKMNPQTIAEAKKTFLAIRTAAKKHSSVSVVVAPPAVFISELSKLSLAGSLTLAGQAMHSAALGAHTGEISPTMLKGLGVQMVIIGHSERRAGYITDQLVADKVAAALKHKLTPIICVGESVRDEQGNFFLTIENQIAACLKVVPAARLKDVVIAYEPIWAIGTGKNASVEQVHEMKLFIIKVLTKLVGRKKAAVVRVVYGGSVKAASATDLYHQTGMHGFLVGGASLVGKEFAGIIQAVATPPRA